MTAGLRIGIDLGGTKIEGAVLDRSGAVVARHRIATPRDYPAMLAALSAMVTTLETAIGSSGHTIGVGMPGSISPATGLVQNANSTWLNGRPFDRDLAAALGRPVRLANDANCFALSEATDGAATGAACMFGVILGTGCGGGIVIGGRIVNGPRGIGGEWGHNPLPNPTAAEHDVPPCWCGRRGCLETWLAGPAITADHARHTGHTLSCDFIAAAAEQGDATARASLSRHTERLARALAGVVNLIDPDVIVLGGGLSAMPHLYEALPPLMAPLIFADAPTVVIRRPRWGDASGVRGAAWLWP